MSPRTWLRTLCGAAACLLWGHAAAQAVLIGEYRLEEGGWNGTVGEVSDASGSSATGKAIGSPLPASTPTAPAIATNASGNGTCGYASLPGPSAGGGAIDITGLSVSTAANAKTSVAFWMNWNGADDMMPIGFNSYAIWFKKGLQNGSLHQWFGFTTLNGSDVYGPEVGSGAIPSLSGWHHIVFVFNNGSYTGTQVYIDGVSKSQTLIQRSGTTPNLANAVVSSTLRIGGYGGDTQHRFIGGIDDVKVYNGAMTQTQVTAAYTATHACVVTPPGGFNAFESSTAAGAITGNIHTKVAATAFSTDVVALNTAASAVLTTFTGTVKVELLDAHDNTGALDTYGCRSSWTVIAGSAGATLTFVPEDAGRKPVSVSDANAWKDVRMRMTTPATGTATRIGCSADNFAIRPSSLASFSVTDANWQSAGTTRSLANVSASGGNVHKAGQPFTVRATAVNSSGATTSNYTGTTLATLTNCAGTACSASPGALTITATAVGGLINTATATYSEAGSFTLQLNDATFAAVDASDGSTAAERTISSAALVVGRFVPDHFDVTSLATPVLRTFGSASCAARSFTYMGQPFGYSTVPQATVLARNAGGATTVNYSGALWKLIASGVTQAYVPTPSSPSLGVAGITPPSLSSNSNGTGLLAAAAADSLVFTRPTSVTAPFNADIALTWSVADANEAAVSGNGTISTTTPLVFSTIAFDAGAQMRFGALRMAPAYGSELVDLPVAVDAQYWDGVRMAANTADQCTSLPSALTAMSNYQRNLSACKTAIGAAPATLVNGRTFLKLAKPGAGNNGSVDLTLQLGASASGSTCAAVGGATSAASAANLGWLLGKWGGASAFDQNPTTRASFGLYRSPMIYQRESY